MPDQPLDCIIAGGGPAGVLLGVLLARAGLRVVVLEKHKDFLRDFRGDTVHPSTLEVMHELGVLDRFLERPHQEIVELGFQIGGHDLHMADFSRLPTHCKFLVLMPQWEFLDFLAGEGSRFPGFDLRRLWNVTGLVEEKGRVVGVSGASPDGPFALRAKLLVAADGRHSVLRAAAGLEVETLGAPMDVLWMRLSRKPSDPGHVLGRVDRGLMLVTLDRGDYWQCAFVIRKDSWDALRARGLEAFHRDIATIAPFLADRVGELDSWDKVSLLTVAVDRLRQWWKPGLLCIGDAAHAMSPIGGVGINLALQDAVATANILAAPLRAGTLTDHHLRLVQDRRLFPTRATQFGQLMAQDQIGDRALSADHMEPPWPLKLVDKRPMLRRLTTKMIGVGVRPEHVRSPEA
jgi:2-polyprenyl-6-methoxyphenol hydroxylase-like FAD-dependent oxidoreductase